MNNVLLLLYVKVEILEEEEDVEMIVMMKQQHQMLVYLKNVMDNKLDMEKMKCLVAV